MQSDYTKEHKEATHALLKGFVGDIVDGIASSRGLQEAEVSGSLNLGHLHKLCRLVGPSRLYRLSLKCVLVLTQVRQAIDEAPFTCNEAVERRLIDGSAYRSGCCLQCEFISTLST